MVRETGVHSQLESYQRLKKWYLIPPCLTLSIIRYVSRVKWSNQGKGEAAFPTPRCSSYRKGSLRIGLDYSRQFYLLLFLLYLLIARATKRGIPEVEHRHQMQFNVILRILDNYYHRIKSIDYDTQLFIGQYSCCTWLHHRCRIEHNINVGNNSLDTIIFERNKDKWIQRLQTLSQMISTSNETILKTLYGRGLDELMWSINKQRSLLNI